MYSRNKDEVDFIFCCFLWGDGGLQWVASPAEGSVGGLLCIWGEKIYFELRSHFVAKEFIAVEGVWRNNGKEIIIVNSYAPCDRMARRRVWEELKARKVSSNIATWCELIEFNCVRRSCERVGVGREDENVGEREELNNFLADMRLEDMSLVGRKFTWYRSNGGAKSRIDRILMIGSIFGQATNNSSLMWRIEDENLSKSLIVGSRIQGLASSWRTHGEISSLKVGGYVCSKKNLKL